jgi:hypothetical protein
MVPARLHQVRPPWPQYRKATLIERYGADMNIVELPLILAADCPKIAANRNDGSLRRDLPRPDWEMKTSIRRLPERERWRINVRREV